MALNLNENELFNKTIVDEISGVPLSDWKAIIDNGTRKVLNSGAQFNTTYTLYTTPAKKKFYITQLSLNATNSGLINNAVGMIAEQDAIITPVGATTGLSISNMSFAIPIRLVAGETIKVLSPAVGLIAYMGVVGYEVE